MSLQQSADDRSNQAHFLAFKYNMIVAQRYAISVCRHCCHRSLRTTLSPHHQCLTAVRNTLFRVVFASLADDRSQLCVRLSMQINTFVKNAHRPPYGYTHIYIYIYIHMYMYHARMLSTPMFVATPAHTSGGLCALGRSTF